MARRARVLLVLGATVVAGAIVSAPGRAQQPPVGGTERDGRELFLANCAGCHGRQAEGTIDGPQLLGSGLAAVDFYLTTGRMPLTSPDQRAVRRRPRFGPEQIEAIVTYMRSVVASGPDIPVVDEASGNLTEGRRLFVANCAACHGSAGVGASVGGGDEAPSLRAATAVQVVEAVRIGPGTMPAFSSRQLTDEQLGSLTRYVVLLRHPDDRGGQPLGFLGPIAEGFVAWVLGLGILVFAIRRIGTKT